jgi:hypothetical protein
MKKIILILSIFANFLYADVDICYGDIFTEGNCINMFGCGVGNNCKTIVPIINISNEELEDVNIYYDESGLSGSYKNNCGVEPSGNCEIKYNITLGEFGFFGKMTHFWFDDPIQSQQNDTDVWVKSLFSMGCFNANNLYATYKKNGITYTVKLQHCENVNQSSQTITPQCNVFSDVLQTRKDTFMGASGIYVTSAAYIEKANSCILNTYYVSQNSWGGLICDMNGNGIKDYNETLASASGKYAKSINIEYSANVESASIPMSPSTSNLNKLIKNDTTLPLSQYNQVATNWSGVYNVTFNYNGDKKINTIINRKSNFIFTNNSNVYIGTIQTQDDSAFARFEFSNTPEVIKINNFLAYSQIKAEFSATDEIDIGNISLYGNDTNITFSAPKIIINNTLTFGNQGNGNAYVVLRADEIDINSLIFNNTSGNQVLIIKPYTPGGKVIFKLGSQLQTGSNSHILLSSGDYYINSINFASGSGYVAIKAYTQNDDVNLFINSSLTIPTGVGINTNAVEDSDFGNNLPANFKMFINGDLQTNNNVAINGLVYVEGRTTFNNTIYLKGALSSGEDIEIGDNSKFYYDSSIDLYNWGACSNTEHITNYSKGYFDAFDIDHNLSDRNITTKIVNNTFSLKMVSLNKDFNDTELKNNSEAKFALFSNEDNTLITGWRDFNTSLYEEITSDFIISNAYKNVSVIFKACADYNGVDYIFKHFNDCSHDCSYNEEKTILNPCYRYFISSDNFAIRPYGFRVFSNKEYKKAAEEFNLTIKAVDENNFNKTSGNVDDIQGVSEYNESLNSLNVNSIFYMPPSSDIRQMNIDVYGIDDDNASRVVNCPDSGVFTVVNNSDLFKNGEVNATLKFSETGVLEINVSEKAGSEFALVDADDTPDAQRFIKPALKIYDMQNIANNNYLIFIPYKFVTNVIYNTTTSSNWLYMANNINDPFVRYNMSAYLEYIITAYNKDSAVTKNFTKTCFPDVKPSCPIQNGIKLNTTFDLNMSANLKSNQNTKIYLFVENNNTKNPIWMPNATLNISSTKTNLQEWVSSVDFIDGVANVRVYFNTNKDYTTPKKEIIITAIDANTSTSWMKSPGATNIFEGTVINKPIAFRYGKIKFHNISGFFNELNATFEYQYWNNGWVLNTDHTNTFGDINISKSIYPNNITITNKNIINGKENIQFTTTIIPYSAKIHLAIPSWLWYHPLAKDYKDPSSSNLDCLTHPCMKVEFLNSSSGWGGVQSTATKEFSENNRTAKIKSDINTSKKHLQKINW